MYWKKNKVANRMERYYKPTAESRKQPRDPIDGANVGKWRKKQLFRTNNME